ncbi:DUF2141 domain-containing protein [Neptunitalea lumnitzerae]|uniref:DUF2141 domain-containing protein n=1 Tax=Neptunitalea lumnitzerae TaxID=2965509 RepID=A0ABQ5MLM4_9FLAO|nr:DUF2141 domain-containing protein [Neptunitalea sp. Y10]GLB50268.1 hypothetical protein Y10_26360 [Neptunitalea sp. Y10]
MKTLATLLMILLTSLIHAQEKNTYTINAQVTNVKSAEGNVIFSLHTKDTFMKGSGIKMVVATIENGVAKATFTDIEPGTYAIMVLHDENENKRMDFEATGFPKEDYGMSNNPMAFGPPNFNDAKFDITTEDKDFTIRF